MLWAEVLTFSWLAAKANQSTRQASLMLVETRVCACSAATSRHHSNKSRQRYRLTAMVWEQDSLPPLASLAIFSWFLMRAAADFCPFPLQINDDTWVARTRLQSTAHRGVQPGMNEGMNDGGVCTRPC